jgi:hypothetical protein
MQNVGLARVGEEYTACTFTPPTDPFATGYLASLTPAVTLAFPYNQIFKGREMTLFTTATGVYLATETSGAWTLSQYTTVDAYAVGTAKAITSHSNWQMADFGAAWMLFNGYNVVLRAALDSSFGATADVRVADEIHVETGCDFRGRAVLGGFAGRGMWSERWETILRKAYDLGYGMSFPTIPGTNYVWWSAIGNGGLFLIYPDQYITGMLSPDEGTGYTEDEPIFWDLIQQNQMGFMPMHWQGTVQKVLPLGNGVMVYGTNGISYMPSSGSTFGLVEILDHGVAGRSAACAGIANRATGTIKEHVFIDEAGWLYKIGTDLIPRKLGYREYFERMLGYDILISYNPIEDEYHIACDYSTSREECYILSGDRLYSSTYLVSSIAVSNGGAVGVYTRPTGSSSTHPTFNVTNNAYAELVTCPIDLGIRGKKTIERVVVSAATSQTSGSPAVQVAAYWRNSHTASWTLSPYYTINYEGVAYLPITALEFKIVVRCTDYSKVDFDDITVQFKTTDKRIIRGTYALKYKGGAE